MTQEEMKLRKESYHTLFGRLVGMAKNHDYGRAEMIKNIMNDKLEKAVDPISKLNLCK